MSFADLAATDSPAAWAAVPWALGALTAEFGMGSGGIPPLGPPGRQRTQIKTLISDWYRELSTRVARTYYQAWNGTDDQAPIERLGPVSSTHCCAYTPGLSTWSSSTALGETWF